MRILLVNHGTAGEWGGGDGVQMRETGTRLHRRGHEVVAVNADRPEVQGFDIVHVFNCRIETSFQQQIACCKDAGVPVVVSPIWISLARALWGSRGTVAVLNQAVAEGEQKAANVLKQLKERELQVQLPQGVANAEGSGDCWPIQRQALRDLLKQVDGLLPNSFLELQSLRNDLQWDGDCFEIAHYGVDPKLFLDADPEPFRQQTGIHHPFVMQAGRIEPSKNQAMLCWALKETELPIVLIGVVSIGPHMQSSAKKLAVIGSRSLTIYRRTCSPQPAAAVHTLPSWMETCGLVSLEAALCGTPLVGSLFGHELEYLEGDAWTCDPGDPNSIRRAVEAAWTGGRHHAKPVAMKRKVLERFNWEQTVDATERLYQRVLSNRKT